MKENKGFMSDVVRIFSITIAILCGVVLPNTVKAAQEFNEDVMFSSEIWNEPRETWTQDEWNEYKRAVEDKLGAQETAYYFSLNGKPFSGYKLYYQEGGSYSPDNLISNTPELEEISTLEGFPGVYVFNTSKKENDSDYYPYGYFRIYKESATLVGEIEYSLYYDSIYVSSKDCKEKKFDSIEFESGDIDCR